MTQEGPCNVIYRKSEPARITETVRGRREGRGHQRGGPLAGRPLGGPASGTRGPELGAGDPVSPRRGSHSHRPDGGAWRLFTVTAQLKTSLSAANPEPTVLQCGHGFAPNENGRCTGKL